MRFTLDEAVAVADFLQDEARCGFPKSKKPKPRSLVYNYIWSEKAFLFGSFI